MFPGFEKIVEQRIKQARREGAFDNLPGAGKPLDLPNDSHIPEDLRLSYKILKNADCLPPELELQKEIRQTEQLLEDIADVKEQYRITRKLNFLITKLNMTRNTRVDFEIPQKYYGKLNDRIAAGEK